MAEDAFLELHNSINEETLPLSTFFLVIDNNRRSEFGRGFRSDFKKSKMAAAAILKIAKSNSLTDLHEIWHAGANWASLLFYLLKIEFQKSKRLQF